MKITPIQLAKRVEKWGKALAALGVAHIEFRVTLTDEVPPDGTGNAAAWVSEDYDTVHFYFRDGHVEDSSEDELDQTIVHEWLHVAMRDFDHNLIFVEDWMPSATHSMWEAAVKHEREGLVDRLATVIIQLERGRSPRFNP